MREKERDDYVDYLVYTRGAIMFGVFSGLTVWMTVGVGMSQALPLALNYFFKVAFSLCTIGLLGGAGACIKKAVDASRQLKRSAQKEGVKLSTYKRDLFKRIFIDKEEVVKDLPDEMYCNDGYCSDDKEIKHLDERENFDEFLNIGDMIPPKKEVSDKKTAKSASDSSAKNKDDVAKKSDDLGR